MRVLVLYAHPHAVEGGIIILDSVLSAQNRIEALDVEIAIVDLVAARTQRVNDPPMQGRDKTRFNRVAPYIDRLLAAESLVLVFPVWNEGFPAILKGFFDRVFLPGVSEEMKADGSCSPSLRNVKKLAAVCTLASITCE